MQPTFTIDDREWKRAANELFATGKKVLPDFLNGQLYGVVWKAIYATKQASRTQIEYKMGQVGTSIRTITKGRRKGQMAKGKAVIRDDAENSLGYRLYWKIYRDTGKSPLPDYKYLRGKSDAKTIVRAMIAHKVKSIALIGAGWLKAYNDLRKIVKKLPSSARSIKGFGSGKRLGGYVKPAVFRLGLIEASAANEALGYKPLFPAWYGPAGNPMGVASAGLQLALNQSAQDMTAKLAERLKKDMGRNGMK